MTRRQTAARGARVRWSAQPHGSPSDRQALAACSAAGRVHVACRQAAAAPPGNLSRTPAEFRSEKQSCPPTHTAGPDPQKDAGPNQSNPLTVMTRSETFHNPPICLLAAGPLLKAPQSTNCTTAERTNCMASGLYIYSVIYPCF